MTYPTFTVVVPTYARPGQLRSCLEGLAAQDYPSDRFDVIVVDDGSPSALDDCVDALRDRLAVELVRQPNAGPAAARNTGVLRAQGRFVAFTDDDCIPQPGWLRAFAEVLDRHPDLLVGGRVVNALTNRPCAAVSQDLLDYFYEQFDRFRDWKAFFTSNNIALRADLFRQIGGFDVSFPLAAGEDRDFCDRWRANGWPMRYCTSAVVRHAHELSFDRFCRQHFRYGRGSALLHRVALQRGEVGVKPKPFGFYAGMLRYPFTQEPTSRPALKSALMMVSQVVTAAGFAFERSRRARTRVVKKVLPGSSPSDLR